MFKTIRAKTILMQTVMMAVVVGIIFVLFLAFFDEYYFERKMGVIKNAYRYLEETDLSKLKHNDPVLVRYRDQNIKIVVADENFKSIFADERNLNTTNKEQKTDDKNIDPSKVIDMNSINSRIDRYVVKTLKIYKPGITTKYKNHKICGYGIITQDNHKYYTYIYETKMKMKIGLSYNKIFLLLTGILAIIVGIIASVLISNRISRPIKQIENAAIEGLDNDFNVHINEKQAFSELSSLATSINIMMSQIREQMQTLEEEIEHKTIIENKRRQFVNNVSHEMKTPLAIISSQVEMLELIGDENKKREYCKSIIEETGNMSDMINDMIVIYSAQSESETMAIEDGDIGELVKRACDKYTDLFYRNHIKLYQEYEDDCIAKINIRYLSQAVDNYITNSVKHSKKDGNIYVRVLSNNDYVRIEVENEGPPVPEEYKDKIWDMFYRGDASYTLNGQKGSGLGLYLVKSIIQLHKGNCGFNNLKNGVVFWIEIPKL